MLEAEDRLDRDWQHQVGTGRPTASRLLQGLHLSAEPGASKEPQARHVPTIGGRIIFEAGRLPRRCPLGPSQGHRQRRRGDVSERGGGADRDADLHAHLRDLLGATVDFKGRQQSDPGRLYIGQQRGHHHEQQRYFDDERRSLRQHAGLVAKDDRRRETGSFYILLLEQLRRAGERLCRRSCAGKRLLQGTVFGKGTREFPRIV